MEGRRTAKLRQAIETIKESYIRGLNVGFAEYKIEELSFQSYDSVVSQTWNISGLRYVSFEI